MLLRFVSVLLILASLSACDRSGNEAVAPEAAAPISVAAPASDETLPPDPDSVETRKTEQYELRIVQPELDPSHMPLRRAVSMYSAQTRDQFLGQIEAAKAEGFDFQLPWSLELELRTLVSTSAIVAVQAEGYEFQGGAHGLPVQASFCYLVAEKKMMSIEDWFVSDSAFALISELAIAALSEQLAPSMGEDDDSTGDKLDAEGGDWIAEGAGADSQNFQLYLPQLNAAGLIESFQFTFSPYQVAPYAAGSPSISVAAAQLRSSIKPEYVEYFAE